MKRHNIFAALAVVVGLTSCAGFDVRKNILMPAMGIAWSTQVTPLIVESTENMTPAWQQHILRSAARVQRMLDSGDLENVDALNELWLILKPVAEFTIQERVDSGRLDPNAGLLLREVLRQFELNLVRLVASSTQFQEN